MLRSKFWPIDIKGDKAASQRERGRKKNSYQKINAQMIKRVKQNQRERELDENICTAFEIELVFYIS